LLIIAKWSALLNAELKRHPWLSHPDLSGFQVNACINYSAKIFPKTNSVLTKIYETESK